MDTEEKEAKQRFYLLRKWRKERALTLNIPAYRVCPDYKLWAIARRHDIIAAAWELVAHRHLK